MCLYFSHDANAHRHRKMRKLRGELGWRGYGLYWAIIEILREERDYRLPTDYKALKVVLDAPAKLIERVVTEFDLFTIDDEDGYFYSQGLNERMERVYNNRHSQQEEEEAPFENKPKYTMSDAAREARARGAEATKAKSKA
ncbi:MAG: DUF4373 domain-containing protein, partial [Porphyromonadaceae bacterium]|nr:DUF4373 domain-containing protein [Porphyromonadaceae bacterium]